MMPRAAWSRLALPLCTAIPVLGLGIWPLASLLVESAEANAHPTEITPTGEGRVPPDVFSISPPDWATSNGNTTWSWLNSCGCLRVLE